MQEDDEIALILLGSFIAFGLFLACCLSRHEHVLPSGGNVPSVTDSNSMQWAGIMMNGGLNDIGSGFGGGGCGGDIGSGF